MYEILGFTSDCLILMEFGEIIVLHKRHLAPK